MTSTPSLLLLAAVLAQAAPPAADDPPDEKQLSAEIATLARSEAEAYALTREGAGVSEAGKVALLPDSIFQWTNPVNGIVHGRLHLWVADGRPAAVVGIYKWYRPFKHRTNEFQSLATGPLVASRDGREVWRSPRAGVEFRPIPDAPEPAATPAARLRQMRDLTRDFAAQETTRENVVRPLRLLTQPLHRYDAAGPDVLDGALFVFGQGTDPEAFLLIEARREGGAPRWHYALARMNSIALRVEHKGREVWSVPVMDWGSVTGHREPYTTFRFDPPNR